MTRPIDLVRRVAPRARPEYLAAFEAGDALFAQHNITTPARLAHFLAQVLHETGGLTIASENMNYRAQRIMEIFGVGKHSAAVTTTEAAQLAGNPAALADRVYGLGNPKKAKELGNLQPGDGYRYRGAGIMQTTGRANYRRMGAKCKVDFEAHPEFVYSAEHALKPALAEWTEGNLNAKADVDDILGITKRINGGTNGLADRKEWYAKVRPLITSVTLKSTPVAAEPAPVEPSVPAPAPETPVAPAPASPTPGVAGIIELVLKFILALFNRKG
jgi:putative chitinase